MDGNNNTFAQTPANGNDLHLNPAAQAGLTEEQIETRRLDANTISTRSRQFYRKTLASRSLANSSSAPTILSGVTACSIPPA